MRRLRLRELRERRFMTQDQLSQESGVRAATISEIENGLRSPRFGTIKKLAAALGVEPDELIIWGDTDEGAANAKAAA